MKQNPDESASRSLLARRTQPALVGVTLPTTPLVTPQPRNCASLPRPTAKKRLARRAMWRLLILGLLLALLYLMLYPLFAGAILDHEPAKQVLLGAFPWLRRLYWTTWTPDVHAINHLTFFNLNAPGGFANLLLVGLALPFVLLLMAAQARHRPAREPLSKEDANRLLSTIMPRTTFLPSTLLFP